MFWVIVKLCKFDWYLDKPAARKDARSGSGKPYKEELQTGTLKDLVGASGIKRWRRWRWRWRWR